MAVVSLRAQHPKKRFNVISFREVYGSVWNHPFVVVTVLFLLCLYQYFPSVFSFLVSVSPVIVCTTVLLGAILVHGQPNDHRVENRGGVSNTVSSLKTGAAEHSYSADGDKIFFKNRFAEVRNNIIERNREGSGMVGVGIKSIDSLVKRGNWEYCSSEVNQEKMKDRFNFGNFVDSDFQMPKFQAQNLAGKYDKMLHVEVDAGMRGKLSSSMYQYNHIDAASHLESSDSESDEGGKSFVNASPKPQEILPDSEVLQLCLPSRDASPMSELHSLESYIRSGESEEDIDYIVEEAEDEDDDEDEDENLENKDGGEKSAVAWTEDDQKVFMELTCSEKEKNEQLESLIAKMSNERNEKEMGEEEIGVSEDEDGNDDDDDVGGDDDDDDDDDDDEDEEEGESDQHVEKDGSKPVTMWTEEDETNLRALGTSDLERNQRLENLLARRRVQRNFSMISERNLIDLDFSDLPFQVAPISTTRVNPFDTPDDAHLHHNIPPIPGSAPSITMPRKNPFDSSSTFPEVSNNPIEERPEEESMETEPENPVVHTNASSRTDYDPIEDVLEPHFMEKDQKKASQRRYGSFSSGYDFVIGSSGEDFMEIDRRNALFSRHESFNVRPAFSSIFTQEKPGRRHWRPVFVPEQVNREEVWHPSLERQSSEDSESEVSSGSESESSYSLEDYEDMGPDKEELSTSELHQDVEETTITADHFRSDDSESESEYSEAVEDDEDEADADITEDNLYQNTLASEDNYDTASGRSMSSKEDDGSSNGSQFEDFEVGESVFSPKASVDESDIKYMSTEEDHEEIEPVYDESPSASEKNSLFSPTSTEM